jgi:hypothetical protein
MCRIAFLLFITLASLFAIAEETKDRSSDHLDIGRLEEKYWSVKDDDFTVVQNRAFTKAKRFFVDISYGKIINDGFVDGSIIGYNAGWFQSERFGYEISYQKLSNKPNAVTDGFANQYGGTMPAHNRVISTTSVGILFVPIYAKLSLLEKKILYLDLGVGLNMGRTDYHAESIFGGYNYNTTHFGVDITQTIFLNKYIAIRLDIKNRFSTQKRRNWAEQNKTEQQNDLGTFNSTDTNWNFGLEYFF